MSKYSRFVIMMAPYRKSDKRNAQHISIAASVAWIFSDMVSPLSNGVLSIERVYKGMRYKCMGLLIRDRTRLEPLLKFQT